MPTTERTDVVFSWFGSVPKSTQALFTRPTRFLTMPVPDGQHYMRQLQENPTESGDWRIGGWPHPLRNMLSMAGIKRPGRIAIFGFSQGVQGVTAMLKSSDAGYIEHALAFDGIHCSWTGGAMNAGRSNIEPTCLAPWIAFANAALKGNVSIGGRPPGQRYCTITHSSIIPPDFPATFDTAREIMSVCYPDDPSPEPDLPAGTTPGAYSPSVTAGRTTYDHDPVRYTAGERGLVMIGYNNLDPTGVDDHIYQSKFVLPRMIEKLLVPRWNDIDPNAPVCTGVQGPLCNPDAPIMLPDDYFDNPQDASLNWQALIKGLQGPAPSMSVGGFFLSVALGITAGIAGVKAANWYKARKRR